MSEPAFTDLIDLAAARLGGAVLWANDEFFAPKEALLKPQAAEWREHEYTDRGKWMDGWETRRRRSPGHDWCLIRLGLPGVVRGVVIDTAFFRGNYPEHGELEGCAVDGVPDPLVLDRDANVRWHTLVSKSALAGDSRNLFAVTCEERLTHLRFRIYPDGGVARLRVHGEARPEPARFTPGSVLDLAALENGGYVMRCSDMFFGHRQNLVLPGRSTHMGDGWETRRRRGPGHDWSIVRLAVRGQLSRIELDTDHFKGNAPGSAMLEWCDAPGASAEVLEASTAWQPLLAQTPLQPHGRHAWDVATPVTATHVRLNIYPDGGVARLRLFGTSA
ncbi:MAG: allantoicase [Candidatus Eisenbacteria bacterium]